MARLPVEGVFDGWGTPIRASINNSGDIIAVTGIIAGAGSEPRQLLVTGHAATKVHGAILGLGSTRGLFVESTEL